MKEYNNIIIWLDYFNKSLTRNDGRRVPNNRSIFNPTLEELNTASINAGFTVVSINETSRFPRRPNITSGYISLKKTHNKISVINKIANELILIRSNQNNS